MLGRAFWTSLVERALKTIAQSLLAVWTVGDGLNLMHADWRSAVSIALGAGALSVLTSFAAIPVPTYPAPYPLVTKGVERGKHEGSE
jgi:hypothetical protein